MQRGIGDSSGLNIIVQKEESPIKMRICLRKMIVIVTEKLSFISVPNVSVTCRYTDGFKLDGLEKPGSRREFWRA